MQRTDLERQIEVLSNSIESLVQLRQQLAGKISPTEKMLNAVMVDYHRVGVLCVNLHPLKPECFEPTERSAYERLL